MNTQEATETVASPSSGAGTKEQDKKMKQNSLPRQTAVALIQEEANGLRATGAFDRFNYGFGGSADDYRPGDLVEVALSGNGSAKTAEPLRRLGRPSSVSSVISALALHSGELEFTEKQEELAEQAAASAQNFPRRDLRDVPTFTIDGEHTKDFDDAISARWEGENIRVWVHVADVAAYVRPSSPLDFEALRRATSVYLPTLTVPMLPRSLSTGACSLVPGEDRAAVTAELLLKDGKVVSREFYRSLISSDARLTYSHVEDIFLGKAEPGPTYAAALAAARQAAIDRYTESVERNHEPVFEFVGDEVVGLSTRPEEESQKLIERLMVLANQEIAAFLAERGVPTLYRTHADGDPERVERVLERLKSLGVSTTAPTLAAAVEAVDEYEEKYGSAEFLRELLWGAQAPASYSPVLSGHSSLGVATYCHFTSPIRRYADLVVHRALLAEIGAEKVEMAPRLSHLTSIADHLNLRTRAAKKLSRKADDICLVSLLRYRLRETELERSLPGVIAGMSGHGCYVRVDCVEGLLSGRELRGDPNEEHTIWKTKDKQGEELELRLGDTIDVRIKNVDPVRGQLRLVLPDRK